MHLPIGCMRQPAQRQPISKRGIIRQLHVRMLARPQAYIMLHDHRARSHKTHGQDVR